MRKLQPMKRYVVVLLACCVFALVLAGCGGGDRDASSGGALSSGASSGGASASSSASAPSGSVLAASTGSASVSGVPTVQSLFEETKWGSFLPAYGDGAVAFGRKVLASLPVRAYVQYSGVASGPVVEFDDPGEIRGLFNALAVADIGPAATEVRTDDYFSCGFTFEDGSKYGFSFDSMTVDLPNDGSYERYQVVGSNDLQTFAGIAKQAYNASMGG